MIISLNILVHAGEFLGDDEWAVVFNHETSSQDEGLEEAAANCLARLDGEVEELTREDGAEKGRRQYIAISNGH